MTAAVCDAGGLEFGPGLQRDGLSGFAEPRDDGIRNLAGRVNADGTVSLYGVTSTVSGNGDQGADPNLLVTVNDVLANTDAAVGAAQKFTVLKSAVAKEVLRGVSLTPAPTPVLRANVPSVYSAASDGLGAVAPAAALLYVSASQINFQVPVAAAAGPATITVTNGTNSQSVANIQISAVAPGLFTLNPFGLAAAGALVVSANGTQTFGDVYTVGANGVAVAKPINLGGATDAAYLTLYGTGLQAAQAGNVSVTINGVTAPVLYAGPQGTFPGLDQVNVSIPASLVGAGNRNVQLTVSGAAAGVAANPVQITIQ